MKDGISALCLLAGLGAAYLLNDGTPSSNRLVPALFVFLILASDILLLTPVGKGASRVSTIVGLVLLLFGFSGQVLSVVAVGLGTLVLALAGNEVQSRAGDLIRSIAPMGAGAFLYIDLPKPFPEIAVCLGFLLISLAFEPRRYILRPSLLVLFCAPWLALAVKQQTLENPWVIPLVVPLLYALSRGRDESFPLLIRLSNALRISQARRLEESEKVKRLAVLLKAANRMAKTLDSTELEKLLRQAALDTGVEKAEVRWDGRHPQSVSLLDGEGALVVDGELSGLQKDQLVLLGKIFTTCWQKVELHRQVVEALEQTKQSQASMVESSRMAAMGLVTAGIAHEVNTPLGAIQLSAELAESQLGEESQKCKKHLKAILRATERAQKAVERTLYYARPMGSEEGERFSAKQVVEDALELLSHRITRSRVTVETDLDPEVHLFGERQAFFTLVFNLVLNGAEAAQESEPHCVWVRVGATEQEVVLEVEDSGPGVPDTHREKIFEAFFTTRPGGEGTGLGLHLARQAAEFFQGRLSLSKPREHGAIFRASFPKTQEV